MSLCSTAWGFALPIKRVIVGPGVRQDKRAALARSLSEVTFQSRCRNLTDAMSTER